MKRQDLGELIVLGASAAALLAAATVSAVPFPANAQTQTIVGPSAPVRVQLEGVPTGALVTILMRDVMKVPYVIAPEVLADKKPVSVNLVMPRRELPVRVVRFLRGIGLTVGIDGGTVYVKKGNTQSATGAPSVPIGSPLAPAHSAPPVAYAAPIASNNVSRSPQLSESQSPIAARSEPESVFAIIRPAHRPPLELAEVITSLLPGLTVSARNDPRGEGAEVRVRFEGDALAIGGHPDDIKRAIEVAKALDKPRPQVEIRAVLFEVRNTATRSSALSILAEVAGASIEVSTGPAIGNQLVRFSTGGLQAVLAATRSDGRFKVIAEPSLAALSGATATINAGSQVPTLGAVSYAEDGTAVRSVVYRDSGVSLTVSPVVRSGEIELTVEQERSSFARTTTGVDDSPTLNRATASTQLALRPGETIALAGLKENSDGEGKQRALFGLLGGRTSEKTEAELLLLIQADLGPLRPAQPLSVEIIGSTPEEGKDA